MFKVTCTLRMVFILAVFKQILSCDFSFYFWQLDLVTSCGVASSDS